MRKPSPIPVPAGGSEPILNYYYSRRLVAVDRDSLLTTQGDIGTVATVRTSDGKLVTGTWRQVFHLNCAVRGHERTIVVTVIGCQRRSIRN